MENLVIKPETSLRSLWQLINMLIFIPALALLVLLVLLGVEPIIMGFVLIIVFVFFFLFLLYVPAYYNTLEYVIDKDALRMKKGVFWRTRITIPYGKITNLDITQGPVERLYKISHINVQTAGASGGQSGMPAEMVMSGIADCEAIKNIIMSHIGTPGAVASTHSEPTDDLSLQKAILAELTAIRKAVEK